MRAKFARGCGPFPTYANAPAWEGEGCELPDGTLCLIQGEITASLGMIAQGHAGQLPPRAGVYRQQPDRTCRFVRQATEAEVRQAIEAIEAEEADALRREAEWHAGTYDRPRDRREIDAALAEWRQRRANRATEVAPRCFIESAGHSLRIHLGAAAGIGPLPEHSITTARRAGLTEREIASLAVHGHDPEA